MSNEMLFFTIFGILCVSAGVFAGRLHNTILAFFEMKRRRKIYPALIEAKKELCCDGPHTYGRIRLALAGLPVDQYLVCRDCGFVSNEVGSFKLNAPAMEVYLNELKRIERNAQIETELQERKRSRIEDLMNQLIKSNIEKFDGDMHKNIPELQQFYRKTVLEVESVYATLKKDLDELERG